MNLNCPEMIFLIKNRSNIKAFLMIVLKIKIFVRNFDDCSDDFFLLTKCVGGDLNMSSAFKLY